MIMLMFEGGFIAFQTQPSSSSKRLNTIKWTHLMHSDSRNFYCRIPRPTLAFQRLAHLPGEENKIIMNVLLA